MKKDQSIMKLSCDFQSFFNALDPALYETWVDLPKHPLQNQEPDGDRHWIGRHSRFNTLIDF